MNDASKNATQFRTVGCIIPTTRIACSMFWRSKFHSKLVKNQKYIVQNLRWKELPSIYEEDLWVPLPNLWFTCYLTSLSCEKLHSIRRLVQRKRSQKTLIYQNVARSFTSQATLMNCRWIYGKNIVVPFVSGFYEWECMCVLVCMFVWLSVCFSVCLELI